jgi:glucose/arabinose dehydrogenase
MMSKPLIKLALGLALVTVGAAPLQAQAPDCTGISDVSDFDGAAMSDLDGLLTTVQIATGLVDPLFVTNAPGDNERLFIVEQDGRIKILKDGVISTFLDINGPVHSGGNEEGLLGLAFHPDYQTNGWFFVYYTGSGGSQQIVERYTRLTDDVADATSGLVFLTVTHNFASNHNGGMIAFNPLDGHLYIATGDGGSGCDPQENGQDLNDNLAKLLRLDVDQFPPSTAGNPFDGASGNDEIWSYGLRNPYRFSFDRLTGTIYIGDVGQNAWEEINCKKKSTGGENYGWDNYEGDFCNTNPSCGSEGSCSIANYEAPILRYDTCFGCAVIGGYVYRGCRMSDLHGTYFYADHGSDFIRTFRTDGFCAVGTQIDRTVDLDPGAGTINSITSFGEDNAGELYVIDRGGQIYKILPVLSIMEVSGDNAQEFQLVDSRDWTWEDLESSSSHPITNYRVYRSVGNPAGTFSCVHQSVTPSWTGGDPETPMDNEVFYYLLTAENATGEETRPGNQSDGTPRVVDVQSACP